MNIYFKILISILIIFLTSNCNNKEISRELLESYSIESDVKFHFWEFDSLHTIFDVDQIFDSTYSDIYSKIIFQDLKISKYKDQIGKINKAGSFIGFKDGDYVIQTKIQLKDDGHRMHTNFYKIVRVNDGLDAFSYNFDNRELTQSSLLHNAIQLKLQIIEWIENEVKKDDKFKKIEKLNTD